MTRDYIKGMLERYGCSVTVRHGGVTKRIKAFIQPLKRRRRLYIRDKQIPPGYYGDDSYLYIGDSVHAVSRGDAVVFNNKEYSVASSDEFFFRDRSVYVWAILSPKESSKEDDYDVLG